MKYTITKSFVQVVGKIWMPAITSAAEIRVDGYDMENMKDENGDITRDSVERWVLIHTGDFQSVKDFRADLETDKGNVTINWKNEESELDYSDCMYPAED